MSKEMAVIALGVWVIVVRTLLGVPGSWQTAIYIITGVAIVILGFLLRGEAIGRSSQPGAPQKRGTSYSFVESSPADPTHDHQEGITSLN